jgi:hypothetical protein
LQHLTTPAPQDQPSTLQWSKTAFVYRFVDDDVPERSPLDPAASMMAAGPPSRNIDCVLTHMLKSDINPAYDPEGLRHQVENQIYECRLYGTNLKPRDHPSLSRMMKYEEIRHTYAFDCYVQAHRYLLGHVPVSYMPANWNPYAVQPHRRPAHPPLPLHEQSIPPDDPPSLEPP